jgi:hypothetical protein
VGANRGQKKISDPMLLEIQEDTHTHTHTHLGACMGAHRDQKKIPEPMLLVLQEDVSCLTQVKQELLTAESLLSLLQGS